MTKWLLGSAAYTAMSLAIAAPVYAQDVAPAEETAQKQGLQDIIVTATRRDTNLQDTPVAVSALDSNLIRQSSPRDIGDLAAFVPNFSASTITGFNAASFAMRGVGQNNIIVYFEPPVAVLVDDFVVPSVQTQLLDTFDIEQVEVLRGPQGTLFGKNTTGGAVTVRTKRPIMNELGAEARAQVGSFGTKTLQGAINIPLVDDMLAVRIVGGFDKSDGYYRNGGCYGPVIGEVEGVFLETNWAGAEGCLDGEHIGGKDVWQARAKVMFKPTDRITALFQYEILRDRSDAVPSVNENYLYEGEGSFITDIFGVANYDGEGDPLDNAMITNRNDAMMEMGRGQRINVDGYYLNLDVDTDYGRLTSVTGYRKQASRLPNSYSGGLAIAEDGEILSIFDARRDDDRKTWQQEVRFATDTGGPFDVVTGAFYQQDETNFCVAQILGVYEFFDPAGGFLDWNNTPYTLCNAQKAKSKAVFAEGTYKLTEQLTLTAGARYNWENKTWWGRQQVFASALTDDVSAIQEPLDFNVFDYPEGVIKVKNKENELTYRASLGYQATDDVFVYGTFSHGFKGGGFNDQIGGSAPYGSDEDFAEQAQATKAETADSFEAGVKSEFFDNRLRFNITAFYVKYNDLQKQLNVAITDANDNPAQVTRFFNAASAKVKGLEIEASAQPMEGLTLRGVLGYQDAKYGKYEVPEEAGVDAGYDLATAPLDRAPKWQWSLDGTYEVPLAESYKVVFNGNVSYVGRNLFTQSIDEPEGNSYLNARTLLNGSITLSEVDSQYYFRVVGRNLTDKRYRTAQQNVAGLWLNSQFGAPRYYGLEVGFKLGSNR